MYFTTIFIPTSYAPFFIQLTAMKKNQKRYLTEIKMVQT